MLPAVATPPVRRFGRDDYSFRPGTDLAEYQVSYDIRETGKALSDRFEINHHPYRLLQSRCYRESGGRMSCHDPHRKIAPENRAGHYRAKCLACHQGLRHSDADADAGDCSLCHMPERRTHDVVQVSMTDHMIRVVPPGEDLMGARTERDPDIEDIFLLQPERVPPGDLGEIYRVLGIVRPSEGASMPALDYLEKLLLRSPQDSAVPYYDLTRGLLKRKQHRRVLVALDATRRLHGETERSAWCGGRSLIRVWASVNGRGACCCRRWQLSRGTPVPTWASPGCWKPWVITSSRYAICDMASNMRYRRSSFAMSWTRDGTCRSSEACP